MHLLQTREGSLDDEAVAVDLALPPAPLVFLSFTDSDLAVAAAAHAGAGGALPDLRLANLSRLRHPYSVDLLVERLAGQARTVLVRLLGGLDYWRYGVDELAAAARRTGFHLAVIPGDDRADARLATASTLPPATLDLLWRCFAAGGPANLAQALRVAAAWGGFRTAWEEPRPVPPAAVFAEGCRDAAPGAPHALLLFYRSALLAADTAPVTAMADALAARGARVTAVSVASLKDPASRAWLEGLLTRSRVDVVLNATAFAAGDGEGGRVLDRAGCPVLQVVLAGSSRERWEASARGLGAADLAMNVVLPEVDGRIPAGAASFKAEAPPADGLAFARVTHRPDPDGVAHAADLATAWARLRRRPRAERRLALVLSDYPGRDGRIGAAVGLDTPASVLAIADRLRREGFDIGPLPTAGPLMAALTGDEPAPSRACEPGPISSVPDDALRPACGEKVPDRADEGLADVTGSPLIRPSATFSPQAGRRAEPAGVEPGSDPRAPTMPLAAYRRAWAGLPADFRASVEAAWGPPEADPAVENGAFAFRVLRAGRLLVAVQPDRGDPACRRAQYHDPALPPRHAFVAFYLWLRGVERVDALVHLGTHGTLEWLPGKAVALGPACAPRAVLGALPVIYPFIVSNPGEAAQARRRTAAVTVGHLTPPLRDAGSPGAALELEALFDEYAAAEALDPRRARLLADAILARARDSGVAADSGVPADADPQAALAALDAWLCDLKEMRIGDGLHVFGTDGAEPGCGEAEMDGLLAALDGRFVAPGPGGAPARGRRDVLPTGRNLFATDPRAIPTRTAWAVGEALAAAVMTRHAQDHGDWPRRLVLDLWGSATVRTGGDDLAQAYALIGARPRWDPETARVLGYEIIPAAKLDRPRVDVTLRISGLFRDTFPDQVALFDAASRAVAALDEPSEDNALAESRRAAGGTLGPRVFGGAPGRYGTGLGRAAEAGADRAALGEAYLQATTHAYGAAGEGSPAPVAFRDRVARADAFLHVQDLPGTDVLDAAAYAEHEGGFAAAAAALGSSPALYHADTSAPGRVGLRTLGEEVARALRGRAANPRWIAGQMRHGYRGAAAVADAVDNLFAFAATTDLVPSRHFDLLFAATCGDDAVRAFLEDANPRAARAMARRFKEAAARGFWMTRRNSTAAILDDMLGGRP